MAKRTKRFPLCKVETHTLQHEPCFPFSDLESYACFTVKLLDDLATTSKAYKSTCKRLGTLPSGPFLQDLAACTETIQPLTKASAYSESTQALRRFQVPGHINCDCLAQVVCQGSRVDHLTILSILEVLQSHAACRGLAFLGCNFGDEALQAVVSLLQKGCGKWWTGPRIQHLDITAQHHDQPSTGTHVPA